MGKLKIVHFSVAIVLSNMKMHSNNLYEILEAKVI